MCYKLLVCDTNYVLLPSRLLPPQPQHELTLELCDIPSSYSMRSHPYNNKNTVTKILKQSHKGSASITHSYHFIAVQSSTILGKDEIISNSLLVPSYFQVWILSCISFGFHRNVLMKNIANNAKFHSGCGVKSYQKSKLVVQQCNEQTLRAGPCAKFEKQWVDFLFCRRNCGKEGEL